MCIRDRRRIAEIREDAALRKTDIQERGSDRLTQTIFTGVGAIAGGVIGFIAGGPGGAAIGVGLGAQGGRELGRTAGNLFHDPRNDMYAQYAGMRTAAMTRNQMMEQNRTNAMDFSNHFAKGYEKETATKIAKTEEKRASSENVHIENRFILNNRDLGVFVEEINIGQRNGTLPQWG